MRFTVSWPQDLLRSGVPQDESLGRVRQQNLVVSWRSDAERAIADLAQRVGDPRADAAMWRGDPASSPSAKLQAARAAYEQGAYAAAYHRANEGACLSLPATYVLRESGPLSPYPVRVETREPLTCTIEQWGQDQVRLTLSARKETPVTVHLVHLSPGAAYGVEQAGSEWRVRRATGGPGAATRIAIQSGGLTFAALVPAEAPPVAPRRLRGIFRSGAGAGGFLLFTEDGSGSGRTRIATDAQTVFRRGQPDETPAPAALADLRFGDDILVSLNEQGVAEEVTASFRRITGRVRSFGQLTPRAMPFLEIAGERHVLDLNAPLHLPGGMVTMKAAPPGTVAVAVGDRVTLRVNPGTRRVFELWKAE